MKKIVMLILALGLTIFYSCRTDDSNKSSATVSFYLTDAPAFAGYQAVNINVQTVYYSLSGESWKELPITPVTIDLMKFMNGKDTLLSNITLSAGVKIQQMRLVLGENNTLKLTNGDVVSLKTPSGQTSGFKINVQSTVDVTSGYKVIIDFDAARSIVMQGNGSYLLKPVVRAYIEANASTISGNLTPSNVMTKVFTVTPTGDTIATLSDTTMNNYFQLHGLFSGTYEIKGESLSTQEIFTLKSNVNVIGGTNINLGTIALPTE